MSYNNLFQEALKCFDNGDFEKAEAYGRQIFETVPNNPDVLKEVNVDYEKLPQCKNFRTIFCNCNSVFIMS